MNRIATTTTIVGVLLGTVAFGLAEFSDKPEEIPSPECLRKLSLDLRNRGASLSEIRELKNGATSYSEYADRFIESPEFEGIVFDWYRSEFPPTARSPEDVDVIEPARIAHYIFTNDEDYRGILTADYTVTEEGERVASEREAAGVLSTRHYMSAHAGSYKRNWAGHFLRQWGEIALEPVTLPADQDDKDLSPDSLGSNEKCAFCHTNEIYGVDQLATFALCYGDDGNTLPDCVDAEASFLGERGTGLARLGEIVTASNEFKAQTVNFFFRKLFGRAMGVEETNYYVRAAARFSRRYSGKDLVRFIVTSDEYCHR